MALLDQKSLLKLCLKLVFNIIVNLLKVLVTKVCLIKTKIQSKQSLRKLVQLQIYSNKYLSKRIQCFETSLLQNNCPRKSLFIGKEIKIIWSRQGLILGWLTPLITSLFKLKEIQTQFKRSTKMTHEWILLTATRIYLNHKDLLNSKEFHQ